MANYQKPYFAEQNQDLRLTSDAMKLVLENFMAEMKELKQQMSSMESKQSDLEKLDRMIDQLMNLNESSQAQIKVIDGLKQMIASRDILIEKLQKENAALKEQKRQMT